MEGGGRRPRGRRDKQGWARTNTNPNRGMERSTRQWKRRGRRRRQRRGGRAWRQRRWGRARRQRRRGMTGRRQNGEGRRRGILPSLGRNRVSREEVQVPNQPAAINPTEEHRPRTRPRITPLQRPRMGLQTPPADPPLRSTQHSSHSGEQGRGNQVSSPNPLTI